MVNHMVQSSRPPTAVLAALGDPTRQRLVELVAAGTTTPSDLARAVGISLPGTLKQLAVLERAGLARRSKTGRTVTVTLRPEALTEAEEWLHRTRIFWTHQLGALAASFADPRPVDEEPS